MKISDINELAAFSAGACQLAELSKSALIELHRDLFDSVGDTGRTSKDGYVAAIETGATYEMQRNGAGRIAQTVPMPPVVNVAPVTQAAPTDAAAMLAQAIAMISAQTVPQSAPLDESRVVELIQQNSRPQVQRIVVTEKC